MKHSRFVWFALLLIAAGSARAQSTPKAAADPRQSEKVKLLKDARAAYYSLKAERLTEFTCAVIPDWLLLLKAQGVSDPDVLARANQLLSGIHFNVTVDGEGTAKLTHNEISAENQGVAEGLKQIYSGMEQMTTGFFQTWSAFVVNPPLPEPGTEIELNATAGEYRIGYKEGAAQVEALIGLDYSVSLLKVVTKDFESVLRPRFTASGKGFLMSGYDADYLGTGGKDKTVLHVGLEYQDVSGLKLPQVLNLKGSYNDAPFQVDVRFSNCTLSKQ